MHQTLSANRAGTMLHVCERLVLPRAVPFHTIPEHNLNLLLYSLSEHYFFSQMVGLQEVRLYRRKGSHHSRLVSSATRIALREWRSATISKEAIFGINCRRPASAKPTILA